MEMLSAVIHRASITNEKIISIEICPKRKLDVDELNKLRPTFCSIVWHYDGSEIEHIPALVLLKKLSIHSKRLLLHVPGNCLSQTDVEKVLHSLKSAQVPNVLVLQGASSATQSCKHFVYAIDLIKFIKRIYGNYFTIAVAAYPNCHPNSATEWDDLVHLKKKVDAGVDFVITQMVFNYEVFNNFCRKSKQFLIDTPIIAGVFIISSYEGFMTMARLCKVEVSNEITSVLEANRNNEESVQNFGIFVCVSFIRQVLSHNNDQLEKSARY
ncbi:methylenetetrahydrofolate reductase 1 [Photinus pyralis]|uniref:methylenetetrahydrofolate reductase 1 n=1 Tax=Photinus pyralis TaxID=7054 RepID=UPI001267313D|nr:methylenetetrahydrofolate reductase 1 [Photinus pyralis]